MTDHDVLLITLDAAVPLHILEMRDLTPHQRAAIARSAVDAIAHKGDALQYGGKRGEAANAFNALARGLAAAAYQPGGIDFAGRHHCVNHAECEQAELACESEKTDEDWTTLQPRVVNVPVRGELL